MIAEIAAIVARGMGVRRRGRWVLRPATFGVSGGVTGIAGPPCVGKSTLLATFATLRRPQVGALEILGYHTGKGGELRSVRTRIGYLPTRYCWADKLTVSDFIGYAAYYKRVPEEIWQDMLERLELDDVADRELAHLPPDIRLRAGLAATCAHAPDLVLLDDPLAGLPEGRETEALRSLIRTLAPTVLITAPSADELTGWCDQILTLTRGRLTPYQAAGVRAGPRRGHRPVIDVAWPNADIAAPAPAGRERVSVGSGAYG
jgi:ABC-2 type transport system ATP-binding protein